MNEEEQAHIVDKDNKLIGYKNRSLISPGDNIRTSSVWIEDGRGNVLTQQRSLQLKFRPGRWDGAGGGMINSTETPESNAYKEMAEEMGITDIDLEFVAMTPHHGKENITYMVYWYRGVCDWPIEEFTPQEEEVEEIKWVPKQELLDDVDKNPEKYLSSAQEWRSLFS